MKRNEDTPIALSNSVVKPLSAEQLYRHKRNINELGVNQQGTDKLSADQQIFNIESFDVASLEQMSSREWATIKFNYIKSNRETAASKANHDKTAVSDDNDLTARMRYQSANTLLTTQLEKRSAGKTQLPPSQRATHYQSSVSHASKRFSSIAMQRDDEWAHIANSYVVAPSASNTDEALLPNERLQYLSLNTLNRLKALTGTDAADLDDSDMDTLAASTVEDEDAELVSLLSDIQHLNSKRQTNNERQLMNHNTDNDPYNGTTLVEQPQIDNRLFMNSLVKHTAIALAIIVPLAAVSAYAAEPTMPVKQSANAVATATNNTANTGLMTSDNTPIRVGQVATESMAGMANPATVASVDLSRYAGQWYEIARLPMYFQRNCAADVTATYKPNADSDSITVVNKCMSSSGKEIVANGEAVPADASGSKLKVTFLPSWLRWAPFGKADYWVLALDDDYKTALVGTPNKKYLWLLSRSPSMDSETYQTYRKIAQNQGYNLADFTLTTLTVK